MSNPFVPVKTANLSWRGDLPFSQEFNDIYFSFDDGLKEAEHVFITGNRLIDRWHNLSAETFVIAETGFGSGLNFLLTWSLWKKHAPENSRLYYFSCEQFPLTKTDLARCLKLWPQLKTEAETLLLEYPVLTPGFHFLTFDDGRINLVLMLGDALSCYQQLVVCGDPSLEARLRNQFIDAWYLDGFAPAKNANMWSEDLFYTISLLSKPGTTLATFSAAALVKQNLRKVGFLIEKIKGFGRKRDMITAVCNQEAKECKRKNRITPWHHNVLPKIEQKKAIVLGAGLAGCYTAYALAKRNWQVQLMDSQSEVGLGASGNKQAVLYPMLSTYHSPLTAFMLSGFLFAVREYSKFLGQYDVGELSGILQLAFNETEKRAHLDLREWLASYPELGQLLSAQEASEVAGIDLQCGGLFIPLSGWINSPKLCRILSDHENITWSPNTSIDELVYRDGGWWANGQSAEVLVIANGYQAKQFKETEFLPLKPIRGQMSFIQASPDSQLLKLPLCGDGHILPMFGKGHALGATYHLSRFDSECCPEDDELNLARLEKIPSGLTWSKKCKSSWAGVRGATTDYLPIVGPVPNSSEFRQRFAGLESNAKRWLPYAGPYYNGLYLCAGFGSRGLTTIPLAAEWLAASINNEPSVLPRYLMQALSPARFIRKSIIRKS
ncbi:bifunctional tRNA (5-methylaminomethyl-2-thiouridine)(34)-methyltransferase MnmD/FAD-dependent 5-carboxymethylaminomethyl-2-thiouridine(34) oxidoreductase MnmC [Legionella jordanis]|uniref:bifunctional tRNA (5-methylaminomethyl-2-thiouridine)(34)-methyltransferase MnmD/FAD-dependent 5-carboxymethylaminomethyl-2-thiouridine(34) oxidoreductase MnmC n=1 Tax=Legionella jordanis TaxID=456 RepID=UPI000731A55D|nr:bifunctional tRNA (5-methylaminomethyl-2-thiouridine)(34)-methyltransferase MnmD/FAD-dependent 5-carboxymethylaminomethyl-2-thiouridine(34) oxidoreductase MnmC [Legionella jordanis]RMX03314.1 bifunctional tRNA (5-methylaminomethyl-2-thiouridine)(34)-methyltransferase MnmD/FAD-dependent 5-carboxymethylaminomethyl-2-thiouridine(34) oxidoreductase MnmC [Legionella jordanis]RMX18292.1 bifunctional tRNA (5-methylaminomethyl-2-thiouridine)(34)-methyltransferase MnmD/FAD-dependent 5-carboxymethylamin